jgi:ethanolamine utilization protein EutN
MRLGTVTGQVVSTAKHPSLSGHTLLIVAPLLTPADAPPEPFVAVDLVGAGEGEVVLCVDGSGARAAESTDGAVIDSAIVAIADSVILSHDVVYSK